MTDEKKLAHDGGSLCPKCGHCADNHGAYTCWLDCGCEMTCEFGEWMTGNEADARSRTKAAETGSAGQGTAGAAAEGVGSAHRTLPADVMAAWHATRGAQHVEIAQALEYDVKRQRMRAEKAEAALAAERERADAAERDRDLVIEGELERACERDRALDHVRALEARALAAEKALQGVIDVSATDGCACGDAGCTATREAWAAARLALGSLP